MLRHTHTCLFYLVDSIDRLYKELGVLYDYKGVMTRRTVGGLGGPSGTSSALLFRPTSPLTPAFPCGNPSAPPKPRHRSLSAQRPCLRTSWRGLGTRVAPGEHQFHLMARSLNALGSVSPPRGQDHAGDRARPSIRPASLRPDRHGQPLRCTSVAARPSRNPDAHRCFPRGRLEAGERSIPQAVDKRRARQRS